MSLFKDESLEYLTTEANIENAVQVVGLRGWFVVGFFVVLIVRVLIWAINGELPITTSGKCLVLDPDSLISVSSNVTAVVEKIHVEVGDNVKKGDLLIELSDSYLSQKIEDKKNKIDLLQQLIDSNKELDSSSLKIELLNSKSELEELNYQIENLKIYSPDDGEVNWVSVNVGSYVDLQNPVISLQAKFQPQDVRVFGYLPLPEAQQIKKGMPVKVALDSVSSSRYGMILGSVDQVISYPLDGEGVFSQKIPSKSLRNFLLQGDYPVALVFISLKKSEQNISGFEWTSKEGAPWKLHPGQIGMFRVELEQVKPISYVFPYFGNKEK